MELKTQMRYFTAYLNCANCLSELFCIRYLPVRQQQTIKLTVFHTRQRTEGTKGKKI